MTHTTPPTPAAPATGRAARRFDLTGRRFGRWTVVRFSHKGGLRLRLVYWLCKCDCGVERPASAGNLLAGTSVSCGCYSREVHSAISGRHHMTGTPEWATWSAMLTRSHSGSATNSAQYIGRGITVCDRWLKFENFFADMGQRPAGKTLDRINNDGNYEPANCRWATPSEQQRNTRQNRLLTANGETLTLTEWAERLCLAPQTVWARIKRGWPVDAAVTTHNCKRFIPGRPPRGQAPRYAWQTSLK